MKKAIFLAIIIGLISSPLYAIESVYVQSAKAKIFGSPKFDSRLVGEVKKGDKLEVLMTQNRWHRVKNDQLRGWINTLCVAETPPIKRVTVITEDKADLEENARRRASAITSAAAARGLTALDRKRVSDQNQADFALLEELEKFAEKITDKEINEFMLPMEEK
ncbi:MAG: SH3 domain-containing protein [bacterium]